MSCTRTTLNKVLNIGGLSNKKIMIILKFLFRYIYHFKFFNFILHGKQYYIIPRFSYVKQSYKTSQYGFIFGILRLLLYIFWSGNATDCVKSSQKFDSSQNIKIFEIFLKGTWGENNNFHLKWFSFHHKRK